MEMDKPVKFSDYIRPICLPAAQHDFPVGDVVWISGWGATREDGEFPFSIEFVGLTDNCNRKHWNDKESGVVQTEAKFQNNQE